MVPINMVPLSPKDWALAAISVVIPAYNAEQYIARAIASCLRQTYPPVEIIVVDDGSTDNTANVAERFIPWVRVIRKTNGGPASARNAGAAEAAGEWIALLDADDWWFATKLERQAAYLHRSDVGLVHCLSDDRVLNPPQHLTFKDLWDRNWIANSSVLLRHTAFDDVGGFDEAAALISVEDYNLWLRMAAAGWTIVTCPEVLVHYTRDVGISSNTDLFMSASLQNVDALEKKLSLPASEARAKRLRILAEFGRNALYRRELEVARRLLWRSFISRPSFDVASHLIAANLPRAVLDIKRYAATQAPTREKKQYRTRSSSLRRTSSLSQICDPFYQVGYLRICDIDRLPKLASIVDPHFHTPVSWLTTQPPLLVTTVDAEEDFDWHKPLSRSTTDVRSMGQQYLAHRIFDRYGIVPLYLLDYPIASQEDGYRPIFDYLRAGRCEIGTQLHPWVNPPFLEEINLFNSFPGNLPVRIEFDKVRILTETIEERLEVRPRVYRAGRYGVGVRTADILRHLGYRIDVSVVPHRSFAYEGGPDFFNFSAKPYWTDAECTLLEMPITAGVVGPLASAARRFGRWVFGSDSRGSLAAGILSRTRTAERIKLTPEGITIEEAKTLVRAMLARGLRTFTLTYHSTSLVPGSTPYVRTLEDRERFLEWLEEFYDFFFAEIGGIPSTPGEVYELAISERSRQLLPPES